MTCPTEMLHKTIQHTFNKSQKHTQAHPTPKKIVFVVPMWCSRSLWRWVSERSFCHDDASMCLIYSSRRPVGLLCAPNPPKKISTRKNELARIMKSILLME